MPRVGVDQDHQVVSEPRIFNAGVLAVACGLLRPLQHPVHLGEVEVAEQRRDHPALRNAPFAVGFEHHLQQVHHVAIVHPLGHLRQQPIMPDIVEIAAQIDVDDVCLVLNDRSRHAVDRFMGCPLWTVSKRPRLEVRLEDRFQYEPLTIRRLRSRELFVSRFRYYYVLRLLHEHRFPFRFRL